MVENKPESCFLQDHTHTHTQTHILHVHGDGANGRPNDTKRNENELTAVYKKYPRLSDTQRCMIHHK